MDFYQRVLLTCEKYNITRWYLNKNGKVDVDGHVEIYNYYFKKLPLAFGEINGRFNFSYNCLTTLENSPTYVNGAFDCSYNNFKQRQNITWLNVERKIYSDNLWKF